MPYTHTINKTVVQRIYWFLREVMIYETFLSQWRYHVQSRWYFVIQRSLVVHKKCLAWGIIVSITKKYRTFLCISTIALCWTYRNCPKATNLVWFVAVLLILTFLAEICTSISLNTSSRGRWKESDEKREQNYEFRKRERETIDSNHKQIPYNFNTGFGTHFLHNKLFQKSHNSQPAS